MKRAFVLARKGLGLTAPNPLVGAIVLDSNEKPVGRGFHKKAGQAHAEVLALEQAGMHANGGTLYVTLEPCCHQGRTPPCTDRIIKSGVRRVVSAATDPNPKVCGHGHRQLQAAGILVTHLSFSNRFQGLNQPFETWIQKKRPLITVKMATSLDGIVGTKDKRLVLSDSPIEKTTMRLRAEAGAILVGVNTILTDDPLLTVRGKYADRKPIRAVIDGNLKTPLNSRLFQIPGGPVWIFCTPSAAKEPKACKLIASGATLIPIIPASDGHLPISSIIQHLSQANLTAVLVEGGPTLVSHFQKQGLIDRWFVYLTPHALRNGQKNQVSWVAPFSLQFRCVIRRGLDLEIQATNASYRIKQHDH